MLKAMIRNFKERKWQWVKQVEVFFVQLLDVQAAIPVVSYALENTGDIVGQFQKRIEKVLLYVNACYNCLLRCVETR